MQISVCLGDVSQWKASHQLKLNLDETELLFFPETASPIHTPSINNEKLLTLYRHLGLGQRGTLV